MEYRNSSVQHGGKDMSLSKKDSNSLSKKSGNGLGKPSNSSLSRSGATNSSLSNTERLVGQGTYTQQLTEESGFTAEAFSWSNVSLEIVSHNADSWFESLNPIPAQESLSRQNLRVSNTVATDIFPGFFGDNPVNLLPDLEQSDEQLGEQVSIATSPLGKKLLALLESKGVAWEFENSVALGPDDQKPGFLLFAELGTNTEGFGQWANFFGTPYQQRFRVYQKPDGSEEIYWHIRALASSRAYSHLTTRGFIPSDSPEQTEYVWETPSSSGELIHGKFTEKLHIPFVAKKAFFLAETNFPSTQIMSLPRTSAFTDVDETNFPIPTITYERDAFAWGVTRDLQNSGSNSYIGSLFPTVVTMGWRISDMPEEQIDTVVSLVSDGVGKLSTIFEDGFRNFNNPDYPACYDIALDAGATLNPHYVPGKSLLAGSQWIPVSLVGAKVEDTFLVGEESTSLFNRGDEQLGFENLFAIANDGVGIVTTNYTNTLAFSALLPHANFEQANYLLESASLLPSGFQALNAKSNRGIALFMLERYDEAKDIFLETINSNEECVSEGCYYLSRIFEREGDQLQADEYASRCTEAGGYVPFDHDETESQVNSTNSGAQSSATLARFCSECGTPRVSESAKFCSNCGNSLG